MAETRANPRSLTTSPPHHLVAHTGKTMLLYGDGSRWECGEVVSHPATARVCGVSTLTTSPKVVSVGARHRAVPRGTAPFAGPPWPSHLRVGEAQVPCSQWSGQWVTSGVTT